MTVPVVRWASIEKEMILLLHLAVNVRAVITKIKSRRHRASGAFPGSTKIKQAGLGVSLARKKRPPPLPNGPLHVNNANWVKRQRLKGQLIVMLAMLGHLVKPTVFVPNARRVSTKTPKAKQNAVTSVPRLAKYPTKNVPGVNCHRGVPAKWVNI